MSTRALSFVLFAALIGCKSSDKPASSAPAADPPKPAAAPAAIKLAPGEHLLEQATWNTPAGPALAAAVQSDAGDLSLVITTADGARHVPIEAAEAAGKAHLKPIGKDLVLRWESAETRDAPADADEWLVSWDAAKAAPAQRRHWHGDVAAAAEPQWAGGKHKTVVAGGEEDCCCQVEGAATQMTDRAQCNAASGLCMDVAQCQGDIEDPVP